VLRIQEMVEKSPTEKITVVKFIYIQWLPDDTPMMIKANLGVLKGQITKLLEPVHVDFLFDKTEEIDEIMIRAKVRDASGTSDKTRERDADREDTPVVGGKPLGGTGQQQGAKPVKSFEPIKSSGQVKYEDKDAIVAAINVVRSATSTTNSWCLIGFVKGSKDTLQLRASGNDGADEMAQHFTDDEVMYSITRVSDQIDVSATTKYVVVHWLGPHTPIMHKAKIGTMKGEIDTLLGQRHISIDCSDRQEITSQQFADLVGKTSGSKSNVKA